MIWYDSDEKYIIIFVNFKLSGISSTCDLHYLSSLLDDIFFLSNDGISDFIAIKANCNLTIGIQISYHISKIYVVIVSSRKILLN